MSESETRCNTLQHKALLAICPPSFKGLVYWSPLYARQCLSFIGLSFIGLSFTGLSFTGLSFIGLSSTGLSFIGLSDTPL